MANSKIFVSATIVVILLGLSNPTAEAAPTLELNDLNSTEQNSDSRPLDENMVVSDPPQLTGKPRPPELKYYPYQQALTLRTGYQTDFPKIAFDDWVLGFQYLFPKFLSPKLEAGADLHKEGNGHIHVGVRWIYFEKSYFRPSLKAALDHFVESKENIGTLGKFENYYLRLNGTVEHVVWKPYSVRLENEFLVNFKNVRWLLLIGVSHAW